MARLITKITSADSTSKSVRTTIPSEVRNTLHLETGDIVEWEVFSHEGKKLARIKKLD